MIVWGGAGSSYLNDGGRYNPATNGWTAVTTNGAPTGRYNHTAVWTGSEMIVWGGYNGGYLNDTFSYHPARTLYLYQRL
jgi:N-acetylneuraminic acid mutarotase